MAPRVETFRCRAPTVEDDVVDVDDDEVVEYGYLQIDHYIQYKKDKKKGLETRAARWVPLPLGTRVHSYSSTPTRETQQKTVHARPLRSCLRHVATCADVEDCDTMSTISTSASSDGSRRVHFHDESSLDCWEDSIADERDSAPEVMTAVVEWIFIDRDICGYSLHEYGEAVDGNFELGSQFASSPYACEFLKELAQVEFLNQYYQQMALECEETQDNWSQEERQLDKALLLAGVRSWCIHAAPEEEEAQCEVCI